MQFKLEQVKQITRQFKTRLSEIPDSLRARVQHWKQNPPSWKQIFRFSVLSAAAGLLVLLLFLSSIYFGAFGPLPSYSELKSIDNYNASEVYAEDGTLLGKYFWENRTNASFEEIPAHLINALVATEDARFFRHRGVDPRALLRVLFRTVLLRDQSSGGGSTITQQLAKNIYGREQHGVLSVPVNKFREMMIAKRLERTYSKAQILKLYLNTVPFGDEVFGVKVASRRFFNKKPSELDMNESAVLVGMLKANSYYHPVHYPERAIQRRNVVLKQMVNYDYLSTIQYDSIQHLPLETTYIREGHNQGLATYFRAHLRPEVEGLLKDLKKPDGKAYNLFTDGLRIYTSIDPRLQAYAEQAVQENMPIIQENFFTDWKDRDPIPEKILNQALKKSKRYQSMTKAGFSAAEIEEVFNTPRPMDIFSWKEEDQQDISPLDSIRYYLTLLNTGMIVADPQSGKIRAWVGGIDHGYVQYDHVKAKRQVGSTFKPIVYARALEDARFPCDFFENERATYPEYENWSPRNSDGKYGGFYSMPGALSKSVNTISVQLILESGVDRVRELAENLGIEGDIPEVPAISLGTVDASLLEMVRVYSTFANEGKKPTIQYLQRIEDAEGKILYEAPTPHPETYESILSEETNAMLVNMMKTVVDSGTARKLRYRYGLRNEIAGKTGTTQNQSDGWFMGFTPDLSVGVWVGAESPSVHFRTLYRGQGGNTALPIAGSFLKKVYQDKAFRSWRTHKFPALVDSMDYMLDCPLYLEEIPVAEELLEDYFDNPGFFERLYEEIGNGASKIPIQLKRRRDNESESAYLDRMRRYNERIIRREDRKREDLKEFWSDKLFGKEKKNKERNRENE